MKFFRNSYRLVPDISRPQTGAYQAEYRTWWLPFWQDVPHSWGSEEDARKTCITHSGARNISLGKLP